MDEYEPKVKVEGGPTPKGPIWKNMNLKLRTRGTYSINTDLVEYEPAVDGGRDLLQKDQYRRI